MTDVHLYTDYWASVLGIRGITSEQVTRRGLVDLEVFRNCLNRPETRLPGVGYYVLMLFLGPVLIPYRMIQRITSRLHVPRAGEAEARALLEPYALQLERAPNAACHVSWQGERLVSDLVDPERPEVVFSVVYPAYKILVAALLATLLSLFAHRAAERPWGEEWIGRLLLFGNFPFLAALLYLIFRDWWTALLAPLPVYVVLWVVSHPGPARELPLGNLPADLAGLAVGYFIVDAFLVPRGMPPTLYLYVNDPSSPLFPYERGQAPDWLQGKCYWVWRFVSSTPAELHKFWETDWERVEVWVRAEGPEAGAIEWIVQDFHFRELWMPYGRAVSRKGMERHRTILGELRRDAGRSAEWVVEVDFHLLGHAPELRGLFLLPLRQGWRRARWRQLARSLSIQVTFDHPRDYWDAVRRLRLSGPDFIEDIPEHLRWLALRRLLAMPWRHWRYPRGANRSVRPLLYARSAPAPTPLATEPELQFKAPPPPARAAHAPLEAASTPRAGG